MIFYKKDERNFENRINDAIFPSLQGGPHQHQIAGVATQLLEVQTPEFKKYCKQVCTNAKHLADKLREKGYSLVTNGTDNHLILWDLRPQGITGSKVEKLADMCNITLNNNTVPGDISALTPGGVRIGTCALTTRGLTEREFTHVSNLLDRLIQLGIKIQNISGKKLKDFISEAKINNDVRCLQDDVRKFSSFFLMPGQL